MLAMEPDLDGPFDGSAGSSKRKAGDHVLAEELDLDGPFQKLDECGILGSSKRRRTGSKSDGTTVAAGEILMWLPDGRTSRSEQLGFNLNFMELFENQNLKFAFNS